MTQFGIIKSLSGSKALNKPIKELQQEKKLKTKLSSSAELMILRLQKDGWINLRRNMTWSSVQRK